MDILESLLEKAPYQQRNSLLYSLALVGLGSHYSVLVKSGEINENELKILCQKSYCTLKKSQTSSLPSSGKTRRQSKSTVPAMQPSRHPRSDTVMHFPFADDSGTLTEILHETPDVVDILSLEGPALRHEVHKIYEALKVGRAGMRGGDLAAALQMFGVNKSLLEPLQMPAIASYINLEQWLQIVMSVREQLTHHPHVPRTKEPSESSNSTDSWDNEFGFDAMLQRDHAPPSIHSSERPSSAPPARARTAQRKPRAVGVSTTTDTTRHRIRADKLHHQRAHKHRAAAAMQSLAHEALFNKPQRSKSNIDTTPVSSIPLPHRVTRNPYMTQQRKDAVDLSSGRAALNIADSFLNSTLAKDLLTDAHDTAPPAAYAAENITPNPQPVKRTQLSREDLALTNEEKALYGTQWKASRGGWVADFGPPHTHTLSTSKHTFQ